VLQLDLYQQVALLYQINKKGLRCDSEAFLLKQYFIGLFGWLGFLEANDRVAFLPLPSLPEQVHAFKTL
jgi:hypothetical protein